MFLLTSLQTGLEYAFCFSRHTIKIRYKDYYLLFLSCNLKVHWCLLVTTAQSRKHAKFLNLLSVVILLAVEERRTENNEKKDFYRRKKQKQGVALSMVKAEKEVINIDHKLSSRIVAAKAAGVEENFAQIFEQFKRKYRASPGLDQESWKQKALEGFQAMSKQARWHTVARVKRIPAAHSAQSSN